MEMKELHVLKGKLSTKGPVRYALPPDLSFGDNWSSKQKSRPLGLYTTLPGPLILD